MQSAATPGQKRLKKILLDDVDRQDFMKTLAEAREKTTWQVHAYSAEEPSILGLPLSQSWPEVKSEASLAGALISFSCHRGRFVDISTIDGDLE